MTTEISVEQANDEGLYDLVDELTEEGNEITEGKLARVKRWFVKSGIAQCIEPIKTCIYRFEPPQI